MAANSACSSQPPFVLPNNITPSSRVLKTVNNPLGDILCKTMFLISSLLQVSLCTLSMCSMPWSLIDLHLPSKSIDPRDTCRAAPDPRILYMSLDPVLFFACDMENKSFVVGRGSRAIHLLAPNGSFWHTSSFTLYIRSAWTWYTTGYTSEIDSVLFTCAAYLYSFIIAISIIVWS